MASLKRILFLSCEGVLLRTPSVGGSSGLPYSLMPGVVPALWRLTQDGFRLVMVHNQTDAANTGASDPLSELTSFFESQGIAFDDVLVCPHAASEGCTCRKPHLGLVRPLMTSDSVAWERCAYVGGGDDDRRFAENLGITYFPLDETGASGPTWNAVADELLKAPRRSTVTRKTKETRITVQVNLDGQGEARISTGIGFFDHMLEQLAKHGGADLAVSVEGDLHIDDHHTVEDTALALGEAYRKALADRAGIGRYGFVLPMDETEAKVSLDLGGRPYSFFQGQLPAERVGGLATELVAHFFRSFCETLGANLHVEVTGENAHHMVEACFKGLARSLGQAVKREGGGAIPSTKGVL